VVTDIYSNIGNAPQVSREKLTLDDTEEKMSLYQVQRPGLIVSKFLAQNLGNYSPIISKRNRIESKLVAPVLFGECVS
jgi:hypothetical protein